jgi:8-oxo-dGTP diphosphatase
MEAVILPNVQLHRSLLILEICELHDEMGQRTGRTVERGTKLSPGEYYLVVHVWIRSEIGHYLVQQRALHLTADPGVWATTAGYVLAGEESIVGAIREVQEEMGIQLSQDQLTCLKTLKTQNRLEHVWLAQVSQASLGNPIIGPEVSDWKWFSKIELRDRISRNMFFGYSYFDQLPD